jgi:hypothetical protein
MGSGGMICIPNFFKIGTDIDGVLRIFPSNLRSCNVSITAESDF